MARQANSRTRAASRGSEAAKARITAPAFRAMLRKNLPIISGWGIAIESIGHGRAVLRLPARKAFLRPGDTVSGPVRMGLADVALYAALLGAIGPVLLAVTSNLTINFLRKPGVGSIRAQAHILKLGRRLAVGEVRLFGGQSTEMVAHVVASYAIPDSGRRAR